MPRARLKNIAAGKKDTVSSSIYVDDSYALERETMVWELSVEGNTQHEIAKQLGISTQTVGTILNNLYTRYRAELSSSIDAYITRQIAVHEKIVEHALSAWHTQKKMGAKDATYLTAAMSAMEHVRKIIGTKPLIKDEPFSDDRSDPLATVLAILDSARARADNKSDK